jgi:thiamine biosynthesis lipoprotein
VAVTDAGALVPARAAVESVLDALDRACSRFRPDSDLERINRAEGVPTRVDGVLIEALAVALAAARVTNGLVDPTVGAAMDAIGYDRDIAEVSPDGPARAPVPAGGWRAVRVDRALNTVTAPRGVKLDLGATAKAWAADRAAEQAAAAAHGAGVLVNLGGDIAVAGEPLTEGWSVGIGEDHAGGPLGETVAIAGGGLATSSVTVRRWRRGGRPVHHIVDPATGLPAEVVWRTVTVAAASCADANVASTASIIRGAGAPAWLGELALPARLVARDGRVVTVAGWPEQELAA